MHPNKSSENTVPTRHLLYLDGLRGLAALYVVIHHAYLEIVADRVPVRLPSPVQHLTNWLGYGQVAVDIFIVLSGYCLMLPVARAEGTLRGGVGQYLRRRARRILPPYYAALALCLLLIALVSGMNKIQGFRWDGALPAFSPGVLVSHLLLLHNLKDMWIHAVDPPMWSVATEWQIYFLFPWLLLPLWRRFGNSVTVAVGFGLGMILHFAFHRNNDFACPWFIGLFAMGMAAAAVTVRSAFSSEQLKTWSARACVCLLLVFVGATFKISGWLWNHMYAMDALVGPAAALFLVFCSENCLRPQKHRPALLTFLETPPVLALGAFSYSLYLVHYPVLSLWYLWLHSLPLSVAVRSLLFVGGGIPLSLGLAYLFHLVFERRFMPGHPRRLRQAEEAAATSPAP